MMISHQYQILLVLVLKNFLISLQINPDAIQFRDRYEIFSCNIGLFK